ncbi:MAG: hypothetical protein ACRDQ7_20465 [Haloechinothrix sp.]
MARRSADDVDESKLLMVRPSGDAPVRRKRHVPVADLLAREGMSLDDCADEVFLADAVASVRRGMAGVAAGLLVVVGAVTIIEHTQVGSQNSAVKSEGRPSAGPETAGSPTLGESPPTPKDVVKSSSTTRENPPTRGSMNGELPTAEPAPRPKSATDRTAAVTPAPKPQPAPEPAAQPEPEPEPSSEPGWEDYSGDYGRDYWDWDG